MQRRTAYRREPVAAAGPAPAAAGAGLAALARLVRLVGTAVAAILVIGILLVVLKANPHNGIVQAVDDAARFLAGPFDGLFHLRRHGVEIAVNWGVAAVVWFALSRLIARFLGRAVL